MKSNLLYVTRLWFLGLVVAVFVLAGCSEEAFVEPVSKGTTLTLHFSPMEQITTRAGDKYPGANWCNANSNERSVESCFVLCFDSNGRFIGDMYSDASGILNGETVIRLNKPIPPNCYRMVVLCNCCKVGDILMYPEDSLSDLKRIVSDQVDMEFPCFHRGIQNGLGVPMFGFVNEVMGVGENLSCQMYFSAAKIQLAVSRDIYDKWGENGRFEYSWGGYCSSRVNNIYPVDVNGGCPFLSWDYVTPYFPTEYGFCNPMGYGDYDIMPATKNASGSFTVEHMEPTADKTYYAYTPEVQNSTRTITGKTVDASTFDKDRTCLFLQKHDIQSGDRWYYRIDFLTGNGKDETKQFIDILRNRHYVVTITDMKGMGYPTPEEAFNNPSSNIEYTIDGIEDLTEDCVASNGQYALGFTQEWTYLKYYMDYTKGMPDEEITLGYVDAAFNGDLHFDLSMNEIRFDRADGTGDDFYLSDPGQKIEKGRKPIKIRWVKSSRLEEEWGTVFTLTLRLGDIVQSFRYSFTVSPAIASAGTTLSFNVPVENGMTSVENIPNSFINIEKSGTKRSVVRIAPNPSSVSRTQWGMIYSPLEQFEKLKVVITQKGKE